MSDNVDERLAAKDKELMALKEELAVIKEELRATTENLHEEIVERKRAEEKIRSQTLFPNENPNPVMRICADGTPIYFNTASEALLQYWRRDSSKLIIPANILTAVSNSLVSRTVTKLDVDFEDKTFSFVLAPIIDQQCVNLYGRDITDHKQAEESLRESNKRLALLSHTVSQLLLTDDPQGLVQSLCERVMEALDCQVFFNFLVNEEKGCLHLNAFAGIPEDVSRSIEWLDYGVAVCGCAAKEGCRIVAEDIFNTPDPRTDLVKSYGVQAYACHPLLSQGEKAIGTLSFGSRTRTHFTDDELDLMKAVADHVATAMDRIRLLSELRQHAEELQKERERERELEEHKREFYKRTIMAATEGKLIISEMQDIDNLVSNTIKSWDVDDNQSFTKMRDEVTALALASGMERPRVYEFLGCAVEAAANATKHANHGIARLGRNEDTLVFLMSDTGPGIGALALPDVALTRNYSTKGTLGMGYKLMIKFADKVYLATSPKGTAVAIEMGIEASRRCM